MRKRLTVAGLVLALGMTAACGSGGGSGAEPTGQPIGPAEKTKIEIGVALPTAGSVTPLYLAQVKGYYEAEGLEVKFVTSNALQDGIIGGGLDLAIPASADAVQTAVATKDMKIVAAWRNRQLIVMAVDKSVGGAADLKGQSVVLDAQPNSLDAKVRVQVLNDAGFALNEPDVQEVTIPGGPDAWVAALLSHKISMTPIAPRNVDQIKAAGDRIVVNTWQEGPKDSLVATRKWISANPNTLARFLRATLKGMALYKTDGAQTAVQEIMTQQGFKIDATGKLPSAYADEIKQYDVDLGFDPKSFDFVFRLLKLSPAPSVSSFTDTAQLKRAQQSLDITPRP